MVVAVVLRLDGTQAVQGSRRAEDAVRAGVAHADLNVVVLGVAAAASEPTFDRLMEARAEQGTDSFAERGHAPAQTPLVRLRATGG